MPRSNRALDQPRHRRDPSPAFGRWHWLLLLLATGLAGALRLTDLGEWSLWVDEAHTFRDATMDLYGADGFLHQDRVLYPLTFLALRALLNLQWIGTDEYSLRLPFVLVGIVSVPVVALCGRSLIGTSASVLAAALCALNPWHIYWSQNARGYILVFLFATIAVNRAHAYANSERARDLLATIGAIGLAALCHTTGGMLAVAFLAFLVLRRYPALGRRAIVSIVVVAIGMAFLLPWLVVHSPFQGFLKSKDQPSLLHFVMTTAYYFRPLVLLVGVVGLWLLRSTLGRDRALLLGCLFVVPFFVLSVIGSQLVKVTARYAICTLPVLVWLAAFACARLAAVIRQHAQETRWVRGAGAVLMPLLLAIEYGMHDLWYYGAQHGQRAQWRQACDFVRTRAGTGALRVLTVNQPTSLYYLLEQDSPTGPAKSAPPVLVLPLLDWMIEGEVKGAKGERVKLHEPGGENHLRWHLAQAHKDKALFVVMVTFPELEEQDKDDSVQFALQRDFELALHLPCWVGPKDESIWVFVSKGA